MTTSMMTDFTIDRENSSVKVVRSFAASQDDVWAAWTEQELLDQWWAPRPFKSVTKKMEFREGGRRLYAMKGPNGEEHWALADYTSITPKSNFQYQDAFCDEEENINPDFSSSKWNVDFSESNGITTVFVTIKHENMEDLEKIISLGFKEGFTATLEYLSEMLEK
ncbi:MAG: SRPBCC domain-containing protein [Bacteroidetes bacterium]|nr:SRPBCC domain-containing protein [Bacteroidota bacterium]